MRVTVLAESRVSRARICEIRCPSGRVFESPAFVCVGSNTLLKTVPPGLSSHPNPSFFNTFHMLVQGIDAVRAAGGVHSLFRCPDRVLFSDSGGFQVFSLGDRSEGEKRELKGACKRRFDGSPSLLISVSDKAGVRFRSYRDGSPVQLSPESSVRAQHEMGTDIVMPLDELLAQTVGPRRMRLSFERTHMWQERSLAQHMELERERREKENEKETEKSRAQAMYGIVHGGTDLNMRQESVRRLLAMKHFGGLAVGGALGETVEEMAALLQKLELPSHLPRHLLGIADPFSVRGVISMGFDSFDSVFPTRAARHGNAFVLQPDGCSIVNVKIGSSQFREKVSGGFLDSVPCDCSCCQQHSPALLHHLFKVHDTSVGTLLTIHNVHVMNKLIERAKQDIRDGIL